MEEEYLEELGDEEEGLDDINESDLLDEGDLDDNILEEDDPVY